MREGTLEEYRKEMNNALTRLSMVRDALHCDMWRSYTCKQRSDSAVPCLCHTCELWRETGREPKIA